MTLRDMNWTGKAGKRDPLITIRIDDSTFSKLGQAESDFCKRGVMSFVAFDPI